MGKSSKTNTGDISACWRVPEPSDPDLHELLRRLAPEEGVDAELPIEDLVATLRRERLKRPVIFVGAGTCGLGAGAGSTLEAVREYLSTRRVEADVVETGCIGLCSSEPIVDIQIPGKARVSFGKVADREVADLLDAVFGGDLPRELLLGQFRTEGGREWPDAPFLDDHPFMAGQRRIVLANSGIIDPTHLGEYVSRGGYSSLLKVLRKMTPEQVCETVLKSGLRGRGGGGFPTGRKWKMALAAEEQQKYLICNADEGDPGAFMDRAVGESDPFRLVEGITIAAYAIGASRAYIYIRAEYPLAVERLKWALDRAKDSGLLGENILGTEFNLEIVVKMGAGAFVCGEETALIHSIEGKRGMPRPRPPYPAAQGLFGKPSIINNVETLANVPSVISMGAGRFADIGTEGSKGTKVFALSGMVRHTGLVEVEMGTTLRRVVFDIGGGIPNNRRCKAVQIGGPSGGCIPLDHLDLPTDYEALKKFGAIMGSGGLVVMDEGTCMVDLAKYFMEFIKTESCGKCIPCREGTSRLLEILEAITRSRGREHDIDALLRFQGVMHLERLAEVIRDCSLCGLGQTAPNPVLSTLRWFRDEYEAHIYERRCPAGTCKELVGAPCQTNCPVGTEVWRYVAHVARGENEEAYRVIRRANPFPSACARVCHHPCEEACRCGTTGGEPIAVRTLKRYVVENVAPSAFTCPVLPAGDDAARVAVIGAGPSGMTAAHLLSTRGYRVTVFEKEDRPGGMLSCAIPEYRLPRQVLSAEIEALLNDNIEVRLGTEAGRDFTAEGLFVDGYRAVYVATGSHRSKRLSVPGEDGQGVIAGIEFLKAYNLRRENLARGKVGIIGGGNSAIDAARVAVRQTGVEEVTVFYRRSEEEMPAYREEIEAALEEGVLIEPLVSPVRVLGDGKALRALELIRNVPGKQDGSGRRRPEPVAGSEFTVELDTLVVAISEEPDLAGLDGLDLTEWGTLRADPESHMTQRPGLFAGGDVVRGPNTVIEAIADGKSAAEMIDRYLRGLLMRSLPKVTLPEQYVPPVEQVGDGPAHTARVKPLHLDLSARSGGFAEVEQVIAAPAAVLEACRCLRCDLDFTRPD